MCINYLASFDWNHCPCQNHTYFCKYVFSTFLCLAHDMKQLGSGSYTGIGAKISGSIKLRNIIKLKKLLSRNLQSMN